MKTPMPMPLSFVAAIVGCAAGSGAPPARSPPAPPAHALLVSLQRDSCFGWCPAYRLDIDVDGTVRYEGRSHVCKDEASEQLPPAKVAALRAAITRSNF